MYAAKIWGGGGPNNMNTGHGVNFQHLWVLNMCSWAINQVVWCLNNSCGANM